MKSNILLLSVSTFILIISACSTSEKSSSQSPDEIQQIIEEYNLKSNDQSSAQQKNAVRPTDSTQRLSHHLKRVPGLQVANNSGGISVRIRGVTSIEGNNSPLFVINGSQIGYRYDAAEQSVDVENIDYINVLKGTKATSRYGSRGTAGVIEIYTKS